MKPLPGCIRPALIPILCAALCGSATPPPSRAELTGRASTADAAVWENRGGTVLRRDAWSAFDRMRAAAAAEGVKLWVVSGYRGFARQKAIWERKWNDPSRAAMSDSSRARDILLYSSMPGTSRHHWGTDLDLCSVSPAWFDTPQGRRTYRWLTENAARFGFFQPYPDGRDRGYAPEKWHWSYAPVSEEFLREYLRTVRNEDITGFAGASAAPVLDIVGQWVDIRPDSLR